MLAMKANSLILAATVAIAASMRAKSEPRADSLPLALPPAIHCADRHAHG
jgi:hypothetical protein